MGSELINMVIIDRNTQRKGRKWDSCWGSR